MSDYHVGAGLGAIYAGLLNTNDRSRWGKKSNVTEEAILAVRDYMVEDCLGGLECSRGSNGGYSWTLRDGRTVELRIAVKENQGEQEATD